MQYGRLEVLNETRRSGRLHYECICSCGTMKTIRADNVRSGVVRSCGCLGREQASMRLKRIFTSQNVHTLLRISL
jgi:hypothetical protein